MNYSCMSSSVSLMYRGPLSFSFNEYSCCSNDRFDRNPLLYSSSFASLPCCSCCANSLYDRGPVTSHSYFYGLRQANPIQWSAYKRLFLNGLDRFKYGRFPICDVDSSSFCEKDYIFKEGRVGGKGRKMGKGSYSRMVVEEKSEWDGICDGVDRVDEVGVMLSLLAEDVIDECKNVGERRGHSYGKIEVVKRGNNGDNNVRRRKENNDSGFLESHSEFEYESKMIGLKEGEMRRKEGTRRERERGALLTRENVKVRREDGRGNSMREVLSEKVREEERLNLSRENQRARFRVEERENLFTRQDPRHRVRKDGSSGSSHYSVTSDDFEIDSEIQHDQEEIEEEVAGGSLRDSKKSVGHLSHEVKEEMQGHGNFSREQEVVLRKETAHAEFAGASSVKYDWRKKSEKKLSDLSVEEIKSSEELVEKQSRHKEVNQGNYRKSLGSSSRFDDKKQQSAVTLNFDDEIRERNDQMIESETRMKPKQSKELFESHATNVKAHATTGKLYGNRDEGSYKSQGSVRKESELDIAASQISSEEEYWRNSEKFTEELKLHEVDVRGSSNAVSGIRMKSQEDYFSATLSTLSNREEQRQQSSQSSRLLDSRKRYQSTEEIDSERTSILRREADIRMKKHEVNSNSNNNSHLKLRDHHSEMTRKHITTQESSNASQETTDLSITPYSNSSISVVDDGRKKSVVVMEPPSQLTGRGAIHVESSSASATEEATGERLRGAFTASQKHTLDRSQGFHYQSSHDTRRDDSGQPSNLISHEDALGSADRLQKSSSHYVGEFVQKVRNEFSSSEVHEVKKTCVTTSVHEDEQHNNAHVSSYSSKVSQSKELNSRSSSHSSGTKGPSDRIWDEVEPSNQDPPEAEAIGNESTVGKADVKRTGKSLWHIIADIFHLQWLSRSETHSSAAKSGGKTSPNQSTSSETWFSGHDPEENVDLNTKNDKISLVEESTSIDHDQEGTISIGTQGVVFSSSSLQGDSSSVVSEKDSLLKRTSFSSSEATSVLKESSIPLPSLELKIFERISKAGEGEGSSSGTVLQIDQPVPVSENSRLDGKTEELKRRKLGRNDQVVKDGFDEWEEAYRLETQQRMVDDMFMREALLEAKKAADNWEVPVGAVLVKDGKIIARGYNLVEELRDSTAHAEMNCIREASNILRTWRLSETTLYVTLEPCPMCAGAILQARIDTVVWGAPNKLLGADGSWIRLFPNGEEGNGLESTDKPAAPVHPFHPKIMVRRRVLAAECANTMQHFFQLRRRKDKKPEPSTPPSSLPISHHPSKFLTKLHHAFHIMFCL